MGYGFIFYRKNIAGLDPDPNVTPPAAANTFQWKTPRFSNFLSSYLSLQAVDGTTITVQFWFFEETAQRWFLFGAPVTSTPSAPADATGVNVENAKMFAQVTARTGTTTIGVVLG